MGTKSTSSFSKRGLTHNLDIAGKVCCMNFAVSKSNFGVVAVHETQRYWPLTGWSGSQFETSDGKIFFSISETEILPVGWHWMSEWSVDRSCPWQCDREGWSYAATYETLVEAMEGGLALGEMSALSGVRRRRFTRSRIATSYSVRKSINSRMELLSGMSDVLEDAIGERQRESLDLKIYEKARSAHCRSCYFQINNQIYAHMSILKDYCDRLIKLSVFLAEIGEIETEYAQRMHHIANALLFRRVTKEGKGLNQARTRQEILESSVSEPESSVRKGSGLLPRPIEEYVSVSLKSSVIETKNLDVENITQNGEGELSCEQNVLLKEEHSTFHNISGQQELQRTRNADQKMEIQEERMISNIVSDDLVRKNESKEGCEVEPSKQIEVTEPFEENISSATRSSLNEDKSSSSSGNSERIVAFPIPPCISSFFEKVGGASEQISTHHASIANFLVRFS